VIYLTFDDGPVPGITEEILNILDRHQAKATFFMVGDNVRKYPGVFNQVVSQRHAIGNHTFHHLNGWTTSSGAYIDDVGQCRRLVESSLFRPPYGRITPMQYFLLRKQYRIVLWSVLAEDYNSRVTSAQCLNNVLSKSGNGSIVVFHDSLKASEKVRVVLPEVLTRFSGTGYRFETLAGS
jgi:peptidoglycan/xylan/chitin deacetylase (PgdA/CDA1 family)